MSTSAPAATANDHEVAVAAGAGHGRLAESPTEIPPRGLGDIAARVRAEVKQDQVSLLAAGIAFYALLALVPASIALISLYGLVTDPESVREQVVDALSAAPVEVRDLVSAQLERVSETSGGGTVFAVVFGFAAAVWSVAAAVSHLMDALNVAYDESEDRSFVRRKLLTIGFTVGAVVFMAIALTVIAVLPHLIGMAELGLAGRVLANVARWVVLLAAMMAGLAVVYRWGPNRATARWLWASPGALTAAVLWVIGSFLFSLYTANFARYNDTYGSLGAIVVVMLWLFLTAACVIVGAEINCEFERQTAKDTTTGAPLPLGERDAYAADTVGETAAQVAADPPGDESHSVEPSNSRAADVEPHLSMLSSADGLHPLRFNGVVGGFARVFGVRRDRAFAVLGDGQLFVRYGSWVLTTPVANIAAARVTGPFRWWKVAGPPRLSWGDRGVTLATNAVGAAELRFRDPVPCLLPLGLMRHQTLTVTVADPVVFVAEIEAASDAQAVAQVV